MLSTLLRLQSFNSIFKLKSKFSAAVGAPIFTQAWFYPFRCVFQVAVHVENKNKNMLINVC